MKAAQYSAPGRVGIVEVPEPDEHPDRVLVRVERAAICGSDLHTLHHHPISAYPLGPGCSGHECVGTIVGVPASVDGARHLEPSASVLIIPPKADGFAEYLSVEPEQVIPLPDGLTLEEGLMAQQLGTVLHCLKKLDNVIGKAAVVVGQGPAGLLFTTVLSKMGAQEVIGLDLVDHRLDAARRMGATRAIHVEREDAVAAVRDLTHGRMADLVVEAVGKEASINLCATLIRPKGEVALFGVPQHQHLSIAADAFFRKQARLTFSVHTQSEPGLWPFRLALDMVARRSVDLSPLISHRLPFARIEEAFRLAETKADGAVKVLLEIGE